MSDSRVITDTPLPIADAILEMLETGPASGAVCALLTPSIKARLKELEPGQVLLIRVDDQSARLDIQAWCDLTGNTLQATSEEGGILSFFIKKQYRTQEVRNNG